MRDKWAFRECTSDGTSGGWVKREIKTDTRWGCASGQLSGEAFAGKRGWEYKIPGDWQGPAITRTTAPNTLHQTGLSARGVTKELPPIFSRAGTILVALTLRGSLAATSFDHESQFPTT